MYHVLSKLLKPSVLQLSEAKQEHRTALEAREKEFQDAIAKLKAEHLKELNGRVDSYHF